MPFISARRPPTDPFIARLPFDRRGGAIVLLVDVNAHKDGSRPPSPTRSGWSSGSSGRRGCASSPPARGAELMKGIAFTGDLSVKEVRAKELDGKECAKLRQKISGPLADPRIDRLTV